MRGNRRSYASRMATAPPSIRVFVFKDSEAPVLALLEKHGLTYVRRTPTPGAIMASGDWVEILKTATIAAPLATVVVAFLKHRHGRKVIITCEDRTVIHAENLTEAELLLVLDRAQSITAIDTGKDAKSGDPSSGFADACATED